MIISGQTGCYQRNRINNSNEYTNFRVQWHDIIYERVWRLNGVPSRYLLLNS